MSREARALGDLAAQGAGGLTDLVRDTHRAIADRAFGLAPASVPARLVHDGVAALVYAAVRAGSTAALAAGGAVAAARGASPLDSWRGRFVIGAVNGAWGDVLADQGSPLAIEMAFPRLDLARADATPRLAVFVHGLCEIEDAWRLGEERCEPYPARLRREHGFTPLELRYNTGLPVAENGRRLAALLDEVATSWPAGVDEIVLIGHSMGALVARCACHAASEADMGWVRRVRHAVSLGAPFSGADLEKAAHVAAWALGRVPETRAFGRALDRRSAGIKDLRRRCDVPPLDTARHTFIAASLFGDPDHPAGALIGDLLVRRSSAWAGGEDGHCVGPANHFALLNHPAVYERIAEQVGAAPLGRDQVSVGGRSSSSPASRSFGGR